MDFLVTEIEWANDDWGLATYMLPTEVFVSWHNGCETEAQAIDFVSDANDGRLIVSCTIIEE